MKKCSECSGMMEEKIAKTPDGISYNYFKCKGCGEEVVNMAQLHNVAEKYRVMKRYNVKLSKWGLSLGLRIPKELIKKYHLKNSSEVTIIPDDEGLKIVALS